MALSVIAVSVHDAALATQVAPEDDEDRGDHSKHPGSDVTSITAYPIATVAATTTTNASKAGLSCGSLPDRPK
jgi:hypothetical protein